MSAKPPDSGRARREPQGIERQVWFLLFLGPGLLVAFGASAKLAFNNDRTPAEWLVWGLALVLLVFNVLPLASAGVRRRVLAGRFQLLLAALSTLFALGIAEGYLQLTRVAPGSAVEGSIFIADPELGFALRPNASATHRRPGLFDVRYSIGPDGCRTNSPGTDDSATTIVLALGCSQTFGHGVQDAEAWPAQLQRLLGTGTRVINAGVPAYGPQQFVILGERLVPQIKPAAILVALGEYHLSRLGQDETWNRMIGDFGLRLPVLQPGDAAPRFVPEDVTAREEVSLFATAPLERPAMQLQLYLLAKDVLLGLIERARNPPLASPPAEAPLAAHIGQAHADALDLVIERLGKLQRSANVPLLLVLLPEPWEGSNPRHQAFRRHVREQGEAAGLIVCDPLESEPFVTMVGSPRRAKWLLLIHPRFELHYSAQGHQLLAEYLVQPLRDVLAPPAGK